MEILISREWDYWGVKIWDACYSPVESNWLGGGSLAHDVLAKVEAPPVKVLSTACWCVKSTNCTLIQLIQLPVVHQCCKLVLQTSSKIYSDLSQFFDPFSKRHGGAWFPWAVSRALAKLLCSRRWDTSSGCAARAVVLLTKCRSSLRQFSSSVKKVGLSEIRGYPLK